MTTSNIEMYWAVLYKDGLMIMQFDGQRERLFSEVELKRVCAAGWLPVPRDWRLKGYHHNPLLKPFWLEVGENLYMRRRMEFRHMTEVKPRVQCYLIGDKQRKYAIYPDGRVRCLNP